MDFYKGSIPIYDPEVAAHDEFLKPATERRGTIPRDFREDPLVMRQSPKEMQLYNESEWDALYDEDEALQQSLEHLFLSGPNGTPVFENLDQDGDGYCWGYSTGHGIMFDRLRRGLPYVRVNPHATCAIIKKGRDEGGWCGLSTKFGGEFGYAEEGTGKGQWPLHSRNLGYDTPELRDAMAKRKIEEGWYDFALPVYDQALTTKQLATCGLSRIPAPSDFNWWSHSVLQIRWVRIEAGSWGPLIINSWKKWGRYGLAVLRGKKAIADSATAIRLTTGSAV